MRLIKFQAWNKKEKQMREVAFMTHPNLPYLEVYTEPYHSTQVAWDKIDCIIRQYINLKDKNGKEIYEGDIVEFYFDQGGGLEPMREIMGSCDCIYGTRELEVVGNMYENPELVKKKKGRKWWNGNK